ncbi:MAG: adenosylcobinamide-phosphate synthase CbiB [Agarilytica sp.]
MSFYFFDHSALAFFSLLFALTLDQVFGEPPRFHPLVGFGNIAHFLEKHLNPATSSEKGNHRYSYTKLIGLFAWVSVCAPIVSFLVVLFVFLADVDMEFIGSTILLFLCIGRRSLIEHVVDVQQQLMVGDIQTARSKLAKIVSRDTSNMDEGQVTQSTIETCLENNADAIISPIFWFLLFGPCAAVLYRASNTLDAMWGYKNNRFRDFGFAAAKIDDVLNWIPARLLAFTSAILGSFFSSIYSWRTQAPKCESPNAGPVVAAGAGALQVTLGGGAYYNGKYKEKPVLGIGETPKHEDISRTVRHINHTLLVWVVCLCVMALLLPHIASS